MDLAPSTSYLLLFRNTGPEIFAKLSAEQKQQLVTRWNAWYDELAQRGQALEGQPLEPETRVVSGPAGQRVMDGPFAEAKEAVGGYVKLCVSGLDEATAIARRHPALEHGLVIEIRELTEHCHLGVKSRQPSAAAAMA
ncbi:YciI family protein [Opitutus terrae]|uniref:DGPFAETKE family protein n=1 Tax=Opitutus terrae (strain DSM 11246 / JCM 15787 / PB90-1) TaxID=452637 RepID=B1ZU57_OPITP|nr:YciI family protein [Opitutus terrae]ACB76623.1 DGPFAETKE family protein [Opitutus terrae PB90-1]